jgi:NitT/TauT family transport system permease protein
MPEQRGAIVHAHGTSPRADERASAGPLPTIRPRTGGRALPWAPIAVTVEVIAILAVWEYVQGTLKVVNPVFLPPPSRIVDAFGRLAAANDLVGHVTYSLTNFAIGYSLAAVLGIALGLLIGGWWPATRLVAPIVWALYAMPLIAIRPMTTIWFGFGPAPIIFLVFLSSLLPVLLNTAAGVRTVDPSLKRAAAVFGASSLQTYRKVVLPATVPFVLTGLRLAVVTGWIILLASELHGSARGFGALMAVATSRFRVDQVFAIIVIIVVLSVLSVRLIGLLERRVSSWRRTVRD